MNPGPNRNPNLNPSPNPNPHQNDESLGAKFDVTDIPDDLLEKAKEWRGKLLEVTDLLDENTPTLTLTQPQPPPDPNSDPDPYPNLSLYRPQF